MRRRALDIAMTAAAAAAAVLTDRLVSNLLRPATVQARFPAGEPVGEDDLFGETQAQEIMRRLRAVEEHLRNLPPQRGM